MEIVIGREPTTPTNIGGRLHITTSGRKEYFLGLENSVPKSVSRQHCRLSVAPDGKMTLTNVKPANVTFVEGVQIISKTVTADDSVGLGGECYPVDLRQVLAVVSEEIVRSYDISHLKDVWEKYQQDKIDLQVRQSKSAAVQSVSGLLSMASIACGFIPGIPPFVRGILYGLAIILAVFFFIYRMRHAGENVLKLNGLEAQFRKDYVCPNPDCRRFLGNMPYEELIKQTKSCYLCKSIYTVKE